MISPLEFPTDYASILQRIEAIKPSTYGRNRNFIDGDVTYLSPYISRGVISTKQVFDHASQMGHSPSTIEKFVQELAWRDYWQQIWIEKKDAINTDLRQPQANALHSELSTSITEGTTGIEAIDAAIIELYDTGYMHNHMRMYASMLACHVGKNHWLQPARWMYYHLLDGDWASNALSWQWVAGTNSHKTYFANQENINKYTHTKQKGSYLDIPYSELTEITRPAELEATQLPSLGCDLKPTLEKLTSGASNKTLAINPKHLTYLYNYYNLDPLWGQSTPEQESNRILLLEPEIFKKYPVSEKCLQFMIDLSKNIAGIQLYIGSFDELLTDYQLQESSIHYKEHPLNTSYRGNEHPRDWMSSVTGHHRSFFSFWKKSSKEIYG